ncbi:hypothetical protein BJ944DRAFT_266810 [Cunninghamella echinulata]|nr:hypothetical protein BJ944DRAFT_266810 [Cunninghamella echinulata]
MKPPQHPGNPQWKTFKQWKRTSKPHAITMPVSAEQLQQDLLKKFNLKDESNKTEVEIWGEVQLDENNKNGWGADIYSDNNNSGW